MRSLARWMLKELRQPLGSAGSEPGRNWPFSIGARFIVNFTKVFTKQNVPLISGRLGPDWERVGESKGAMPLSFSHSKKERLSFKTRSFC
ncbi:hypothetical protein [Desulfosporosinus hippei]|uniref:hypothetical protein n=1 Tax=Desulfosporosinus hippei TaxID=569859 RepID=UPI000B89A502|nr:hypothetical protein [Desulfosporosinus hippei]